MEACFRHWKKKAIATFYFTFDFLAILIKKFWILSLYLAIVIFFFSPNSEFICRSSDFITRNCDFENCER